MDLSEMFRTVKLQAKSVSSSIKTASLKLPYRFDSDKNRNFKFPGLLEQINWPAFSQKPVFSKEEDDILDRFIKVIQIEEDAEYAQSKFYNYADRRRADREEIRRKLAMGADDDQENTHNKKSSLQTRLQNGKNLQLCFMNETASDCESQCSDTESTQGRIEDNDVASLNIKNCDIKNEELDLAKHQARLQAEARQALSQAKEMAKMQMRVEKQHQLKSPIAEIVKDSFTKIGFSSAKNKRRMSRQILTDMNVAQLQVIVNDFHTQIEKYNEALVQLLLARDDLHMEQDSMLVDIEDLTKHLNAKQKAAGTSDGKETPSSKTTKPESSLFKNTITAKAIKLKSFVQK